MQPGSLLTTRGAPKQTAMLMVLIVLIVLIVQTAAALPPPGLATGWAGGRLAAGRCTSLAPQGQRLRARGEAVHGTLRLRGGAGMGTINVKTLKGETFQVEADEGDGVPAIKAKIARARALGVSDEEAADPKTGMKLIHNGSILSDSAPLAPLLADKAFVVMMPPKKAAPAKPAAPAAQMAPTSLSPPAAAPAAAAPPQPAVPSATAAAAPAAPLAAGDAAPAAAPGAEGGEGAGASAAVAEMCAMGFAEDEVATPLHCPHCSLCCASCRSPARPPPPFLPNVYS
jgi:hypothetical protein